jgi:tetratricopeptide (TPR) repeat protein
VVDITFSSSTACEGVVAVHGGVSLDAAEVVDGVEDATVDSPATNFPTTVEVICALKKPSSVELLTESGEIVMAAFSRAFVKASLTSDVLNAALMRAGDNNTMHALAYDEGLRLSAEGRHAEAIDHLQVALAEHPDDTRVLFALGNTARALGMSTPAEQFYRMVLALEPERLEALINLANLLRAEGNPDGAIALLEPVRARAPDSHEILMALGSAHRELGDLCNAEAYYRDALALRPGYAQALVNLGDIRSDAKEYEDALLFYARALAIEPDNKTAIFHRAFLHLERGSMAEGWRDYEARLAVDPIAHDHDLPRWNGETGKRVLVTAEQGVGDELMFASVVPHLAQHCGVVLECDPRLVSLFARSFPGIDVRASAISKRGAGFRAHHEICGAEASIEIGSLPRHLRPLLSNFPNPHAYLVPDAAEKARWQSAFADNAHIGICWRSGKQTNGRAVQFAPLAAWADFIRAFPGTIVCAQYDARDDEIAALESLSGRRIFVPKGIDQKFELDRACAMLSALDCLVSAPTAVSWLAAGAGVATYKILSRRSWTNFGTDFEPFAPSAHCIAPDAEGDWANGFLKAAEEIKARLR